MDVETLVRPVVEGSGLELVEVTFGREAGQQVLRVTVDAPARSSLARSSLARSSLAQPDLAGPDLDTLSSLSEKLSRRLDLEGFGRGHYQLEVSSPGIERRLRTAAQFERSVGSRARVKTSVPVDGVRVHEGTIVKAGDDHVVLDVDGAPRRVALADIASARTLVDWDAELKGSRA
ncbi:MAG TPA: ribosome maturation factor RimP [Actinomycetota bacterium]